MRAASSAAAEKSEPDCSFSSPTTCWTVSGRFPAVPSRPTTGRWMELRGNPRRDWRAGSTAREPLGKSPTLSGGPGSRTRLPLGGPDAQLAIKCRSSSVACQCLWRRLAAGGVEPRATAAGSPAGAALARAPDPRSPRGRCKTRLGQRGSLPSTAGVRQRRIAVERNAVDSMRLGNQERGALRSLGIGYVALGVAAVVLYLSLDTD